MTDAEVDRFMGKVEKTESCWNWRGRVFGNGYGVFVMRHQNWAAHRLSFVLNGGTVETTQVLDHLCRNRACVNPAHLEPVTPAENIRRGETGIKNSSKTHCSKGHEYTPENTLYPHGWRNCKTCHKAIKKACYERKKQRERTAA